MSDKEALSARPFWLSALLLASSIIYLFPEIAFNAALVDAAGGKNVDAETVKRVELFGRMMSGIGVSLLVIDLLLKGSLTKGVMRPLLVIAGTLILIWPLVFYGQKAFIDRFIIDTASAEERQAAYYVNLVKKAVTTNTLELKGVPFDPDAELTSEDKTFLSLFGALMFLNADVLARLEDKKHAIARRYVGSQADLDFDNYYAQYRSLRKDLIAAYGRFEDGAKKYEAAMGSAEPEAQKVFNKIDNQVAAAFSDYRDTRNSFYRDQDKIADDLAYYLPRYFDNFKHCNQNRCRALDDYHKKMAQHAIDAPNYEYWLIQEEIDYGLGYYLGKAVTGVFTYGLSVVDDAIGKAQGKERPKYRYIIANDKEHYYQLLLTKASPNFIKKTGYPIDIESEVGFKSHPKTSSAVASNLRQQGFDLPSDWHIEDRDTIRELLGGKAARQAKADWDRQMRNQGLSLSPEDDWNDFQMDAGVQRQIKNGIGKRFYIHPVSLEMNNQQFRQKLMEPAINREADRLISVLNAELPAFVPGGQHYEAGRQALRSIIVPPISIGLSLLLILLTSMKIPVKTYQLFAGRKRAINDKEKWAIRVVTLIGVTSILLYPVISMGNQFTDKDSTTGYLLEQLRENNSGLQSQAILWIMNAQPIMTPMGSELEAQIQFVDVFAPQDGALYVIDKSIADMFASNPNKAKAPVNPDVTYDKVAVTVKASMNARIRIMNIGPVYRPGMLLAPGRYDIEVSDKNGSKRAWVTVPNSAAEHEVKFN